LREFAVLGFYWPIRGELDLRGIARGHLDAGGITAVPVVVAKNEPVEFWSWEPGSPMQRGFWNIPVPLERRCVTPEVLVIPLVGYDAAGYRLGYGGGFYDRTLAQLQPKPYTVGLGFTQDFLFDFEPEPHDVPLNAILNDNGVVWPIR
jgi:5,10-methenyltetrahydrofolate synthetase